MFQIKEGISHKGCKVPVRLPRNRRLTAAPVGFVYFSAKELLEFVPFSGRNVQPGDFSVLFVIYPDPIGRKSRAPVLFVISDRGNI